MGYCICVRVKNVNSSEIKINSKEPNNDISKPFQFLLNSNELIPVKVSVSPLK